MTKIIRKATTYIQEEKIVSKNACCKLVIWQLY